MQETFDIFENNFSTPVSVFVIDYFNWAIMGNLTFDPANFPDPQGMVDHLHAKNTEIMVSTWPFSSTGSATHDGLEQQGFAVFSGPDDTNATAWPGGAAMGPVFSMTPATRMRASGGGSMSRRATLITASR